MTLAIAAAKCGIVPLPVSNDTDARCHYHELYEVLGHTSRNQNAVRYGYSHSYEGSNYLYRQSGAFLVTFACATKVPFQ